MPSLTAAKMGAKSVIATDVDELALEMVWAAAVEQGFIRYDGDDCSTEYLEQQRFVTKRFDLTSRENVLPDADLYIFSDVFESAAVAEGAAWHVHSLLSKYAIQNNYEMEKTPSDSNEYLSRMNATNVKCRVWVFAQSDRAQRDSFLRKMQHHSDELLQGWTTDHNPDLNANLWLFDLDETLVEYN